ncbi:chemotaxis protein CheW [Scopulibacillus cellulosilyticus]|uniref:Chemotaxis protein CheW n=1 Tax=Scopulibacillus cellulosilyticus TaxID=2665665 RepID=A0ABW2Q0C1_9BACL
MPYTDVSVNEIMTFNIGNKVIGLDIHHIMEIIEPLPVVNVPHCHRFFKGFIRHRNDIIPVADLYNVFGVSEPPLTSKSSGKYVITSYHNRKITLTVQNVNQINKFNHVSLEKDFLSEDLKSIVSSVIKDNDNEIIMLNTDALFSVIKTLNQRKYLDIYKHKLKTQQS